MIKINDTDISGVYVGSSAATAIYLGSQQIWTATSYELPDVPYLCNYNAKDFDETQQVFYRSESSQTFNYDLSGTNVTYSPVKDGNKVIFSGNTSYDNVWADVFNFTNDSDNPFNINSANTDITIIYKARFISNNHNTLLGNRRYQQDYNWMVRRDVLHTSQGLMLSFQPSEEPATIVIRVSGADGERKCIETQQSTTANDLDFSRQSKTIAFFSDGGNTANGTFEYFKGDFYWLYVSREYLTDSQVQQVIDYNENK